MKVPMNPTREAMTPLARIRDLERRVEALENTPSEPGREPREFRPLSGGGLNPSAKEK